MGLVLMLLGGCAQTGRDLQEAAIPSHQPTNFYTGEGLPPQVRRVAVLPIYNAIASEEALERFDAIWLTELGKRARFETVVITDAQLEADYGKGRLSLSEELPAMLLPEIHERTGADAVILAELTRYQPYRPVAVGLRCKLVDVRTGEVYWGLDEVFDAGEPGVSVGAKRYQHDSREIDMPVDTSGTILGSPTRFFQYVAWSATSTLPGREKFNTSE